jgi:hypothetical protein
MALGDAGIKNPDNVVFFGVTMVYYAHLMLEVASNEKAFPWLG